MSSTSKALCHSGVALAILLVAARGASGASTPITTCGSAVSGSAHLPADLNCSAFVGDAVTLLGGSLDLQGHTLTGGTGYAVRCNASCQITSNPANGTITGATLAGVFVGDPMFEDQMTLKISDTIVTANTGEGIHAGGLSTVIGQGTTVSANTRNGIFAGGGQRVLLFDSTVTGNGQAGISHPGQLALLKNCTVSSNGFEGVSAWNVKVIDSNVLNNGTAGTYPGVDRGAPGNGAGSGVRFIRSHAEGNSGLGLKATNSGGNTLLDSTVKSNLGGGVQTADRLSVKRSDVSNNGGDGLVAGPTIVLVDATITGNAGYGARGPRTMRIKRTSITTNDNGLRFQGQNVGTGKATIIDSTVAANRFSGVVGDDYVSISFTNAAIISTKRSSINGNGTDPTCNMSPVVCADLVAGVKEPTFDFVPATYECNTSYRSGTAYAPCPDCPPGLFPGIMYGICTQDCNNNTLNGAEICDMGGETATCDNNCTPAACGDQKVNVTAGEACDDGNGSSMDACKNDCSFNVCGDGTVRTGFEECDDGNASNNDVCRNDCGLNICGDGFIRTGFEACDDGNLNNGDGCTNLCQIG